MQKLSDALDDAETVVRRRYVRLKPIFSDPDMPVSAMLKEMGNLPKSDMNDIARTVYAEFFGNMSVQLEALTRPDIASHVFVDECMYELAIDWSQRLLRHDPTSTELNLAIANALRSSIKGRGQIVCMDQVARKLFAGREAPMVDPWIVAMAWGAVTDAEEKAMRAAGVMLMRPNRRRRR